MRLDDATAIYVGGQAALAVYVGGVQVWPGTTPVGTYATGLVRFDATHGGTPPRIASMAFYSGATLLTGTASASSESTTLTGASKAFDGDTATYWEPGLDGTWWLALTFSSPSSFDRVDIRIASVESQDSSGAPLNLTVIGRTGSTDTELWTETGIAAWSPNETRTFTP